MINDKILLKKEISKKLKKHRKDGQTIAFTNGCFDILHYGHVAYLEKAKKKNRILVLGLNSDASIRKIKGPKRPIISQKYRSKLMAALACVDYVCLFSAETPLNLIKEFKPDILIKGADWKGRGIVGEDFVQSYGGAIEYIKFEKGLSTTNIIESIKKSG